MAPGVPLLVFAAFFGAGSAAAQEGPERIELPPHAIVVTHASRFYHSDSQTAEFTNQLLRQAGRKRWPIFMLGQHDVATDPDWYARQCGPTVTSLLSRAGEHSLLPADTTDSFTVTVLGGYHCACLARTISYIIAGFIEETQGESLNLHLPMQGIYTGYLLDQHGNLVPGTPAEEANADASVDGLNLATVTGHMSDQVWKTFMRDSLRLGVFRTSPILQTNLQGVEFRLYRQNRLLDTFSYGAAVGGDASRKVIRFYYE